MGRAMARALVDQLYRGLATGGSPAADESDYGWFRDRVSTIAKRCRAADGICIW